MTEQSQAAARAVDDLYRRHGAEVYRYALAVLGNRADAEDVTQTTFLNAYRSIEQGVRPRKPANWLLTIASNAIKQRFRQDSARPRQVALDSELASANADDEGPSVGELLTALARIPPQQRQAIVLREFEGRSYKEIAGILGVTTSALETLLFRARRSLAEELEHQLTCTEAQLAISRAVDGRLGRKERRRLRTHLDECPDCARFARLQQRHRGALRGLALLPVPLTLPFLRGLEDSAAAAAVPMSAGTSAAAIGGATTGGVAATGGGILAGGAGAKAAAVVAAASVAGGVGVVGASEVSSKTDRPAAKTTTAPGQRIGQTAPRGVLVPGRGVARGKANAPGQARANAKRPPHATRNATTGNPKAQRAQARRGKPETNATSRARQTERPTRGRGARDKEIPAPRRAAQDRRAQTNTKPTAKKTPPAQQPVTATPLAEAPAPEIPAQPTEPPAAPPADPGSAPDTGHASDRVTGKPAK